jgi:hypothetical protein
VLKNPLKDQVGVFFERTFEQKHYFLEKNFFVLPLKISSYATDYLERNKKKVTQIISAGNQFGKTNLTNQFRGQIGLLQTGFS